MVDVRSFSKKRKRFRLVDVVARFSPYFSKLTQ